MVHKAVLLSHFPLGSLSGTQLGKAQVPKELGKARCRISGGVVLHEIEAPWRCQSLT